MIDRRGFIASLLGLPLLGLQLPTRAKAKPRIYRHHAVCRLQNNSWRLEWDGADDSAVWLTRGDPTEFSEVYMKGEVTGNISIVPLHEPW